MESARWMVSKGDLIDIKLDRWLASGDLVELNAGSTLRWVKDIIDPVSKSWDVLKIRDNFSPASAIKFKIIQTPIAWNVNKDVLWWPNANKNGEYSVKSGYFQTKIMRSRKRIEDLPLRMGLMEISARRFGRLKCLKS